MVTRENTVQVFIFTFPPLALTSSGSRGLPQTSGTLRLCLPQGDLSILLHWESVKETHKV